MKEILIFAGTTEGRKLSEYLAESGVAHTICVATEYGEIVLHPHPLVKVHQGRMDQEAIREFIQAGEYLAVVDATHPYAKIVTDHIKGAMEGMTVPYLRLKRDMQTGKEGAQMHWFDSVEACAKALEETRGNILLTTGSKDLAKYCISEEVRNRLYVRVLPSVESISLCTQQGICGKQILAMQGPFTEEMNTAVIRQYHISCLVTKETGVSGGYQEKLKAAEQAGIPVFVVGHPLEEGMFFPELCEKLSGIIGRSLAKKETMEISLAGIGMGSRNSMTKEVWDAIEHADILLGAKRMLEGFEAGTEKKAYYQAKDIIPYLKEIQEKNGFSEKKKVVVLFSGDTGFYSGCKTLYHALLEEIEKGQLQASVKILPGISSVAYLASCIGESYEDALVTSIHGKKIYNLVKKIQREKKTYLLLSGLKDIHALGQALVNADMTDCQIVAGYQLSYPGEKISRLTPEECRELKEEGLYTCLIRNPGAVEKKITPGIADEEFERAKVPMTKEEVREVSLCKMNLHKNAVVYDIGSGTGSIAVEIAALSDEIMVYALEQKEEAVALIQKNREKFSLENIAVLKAKVPEGLSELPAPTHAFIGGSGGNMKEILSVLYEKNPRMRVVINAISMETICEIREVLSLFPIENEEVLQLQASRAKKAGSYHLMRAENPVWICAFNFCEQAAKEGEQASI